MNESENSKDNSKNKKNIASSINDLDETYSKYIIDDQGFISQSSSDDIETKMNKMIEIIKKGGNINDISKYKNNIEKNKINEIKKEDDKSEEIKEKKEKNMEIKNKRKINNPSIMKKNNYFEKEKSNKISFKKIKLEMLKKQEENNLNIINLQSKIKQEHIKNLENQLDKQNIKDENLKKGLDVSKTDSQIEYDLNSDMKIENGVAYLSYIFENHLIFLKLDFFQNLFELKSKKKKKQENYFKKNTFNNVINLENNLKNSLKIKRQSVFVHPINMELQEKKLERNKKYNNQSLSFGKKKRQRRQKRKV